MADQLRNQFREDLLRSLPEVRQHVREVETSVRSHFLKAPNNVGSRPLESVVKPMGRLQRELFILGSCPLGFAVTSAFGFRLCIRSEEAALKRSPLDASLMRYGTWDDCHQLDAFYPNLRQRQCAILEVGANIGLCSLYFAASGFHAIAIEPHPFNVALMEGSLGLLQEPPFDPFLNVTVIASAAGNKSGTVKLFVDPLNAGGHYLHELNDRVVKGSDIAVPIVRLDDLKLSNICAVLLDVEYYEDEVLAGAEQLFSERGTTNEVEVVAFEWNPAKLRDLGKDETFILRWLHERGFEIFETGQLNRSWAPSEWHQLVSWAESRTLMSNLVTPVPRSVDLVALRTLHPA
eukprot:TRINITY_DN34965_c0_g1_i1.p1 TRINITY_DN34965_c0_g1~~TRINITY_DN34965_c0_g1_i1.p1  ORF type:complete len:388 (-),score=46.69 TRINITY_DN34965_c0_g1_i1:3-1046(-)